jgi:hypothetical protein
MHTLHETARRQRQAHRVSAAESEGRGMAAAGRLSQLLETRQARTMLSGSKDMGACPSIWALEHAFWETVSEMS